MAKQLNPDTYIMHSTDSIDPSKNETQRTISKEAINALPLIQWTGPTKVLNTMEEFADAAVQLSEASILGFDTETRPSFKKGEYYPTSLLQLASDSCVYLFRLKTAANLQALVPLFESEHIIKTGVAIHDDLKALQKLCPFSPQGFVEITQLTAQLAYTSKGLRALAALLLGGRISKAAQVSNWARSELEPKQIQYAATDAWISRELYLQACKEQSEKL